MSKKNLKSDHRFLIAFILSSVVFIVSGLISFNKILYVYLEPLTYIDNSQGYKTHALQIQADQQHTTLIYIYILPVITCLAIGFIIGKLTPNKNFENCVKFVTIWIFTLSLLTFIFSFLLGDFHSLNLISFIFFILCVGVISFFIMAVGSIIAVGKLNAKKSLEHIKYFIR